MINYDHDTFKVQTIKIGRNEVERITNSKQGIVLPERHLYSRIWGTKAEHTITDKGSRSNELKQKQAIQKEEQIQYLGSSKRNPFQFSQMFNSQENIDIFQETARFGDSFTVKEQQQNPSTQNKDNLLSTDKLFYNRLPPLQDLSRQPIKTTKQLNQFQQQATGFQTISTQYQKDNYHIDPLCSLKKDQSNLLKTVTIKYSNSLKFLQNRNSSKPQTSPDQTNNSSRSRQQDEQYQRDIKSVKESRASSSEQRRIKVLPIRLQGGGLFDSPVDQHKNSSLPRTNRFDFKKIQV